jgi:hypothetical protein
MEDGGNSGPPYLFLSTKIGQHGHNRSPTNQT